MQDGLRVVVNTQTPLVRFPEDDAPKLTTGGVVRMLLPLLQRWSKQATIRSAEWIAMGSDRQPARWSHEGIDLAFVGLSDEAKRGYARVKERMWALLNSNPSTPTPHGEHGIPESAWAAFDGYQVLCAEAMREAGERMGGIDLAYVHDFQQIGVAEAWKGDPVPKIFHLHTPFPSVLPSGWAEYVVARLRRFDAVIVSTQRYAGNLRAAGLDTPVHVVHPFIDPATFREPAPGEVARFRAELSIAPDDRIVLNVGRMDPMKGQDRLLYAMPRVLAEEPRARLVLVGNGSFSSARRGGLGLDKGRTWRAHLESLAAELAIEDRVTFAGHLGDDLLPAAYATAEAFALPSTREGFGLAAIEAWRYHKPVLVCDRAGVSELVADGVSGLVVDCSDASKLAEGLVRLLADADAAARMGKEGFAASKAATLAVGSAALERIFARVMEERSHATIA